MFCHSDQRPWVAQDGGAPRTHWTPTPQPSLTSPCCKCGPSCVRSLASMTHTCRAPSLFCLLLPPFLLPKASASSSRLLYPSMHVTFSKKPPLASPRKEFLPQPLHSAEIKGAGSAARQPGVTPRLLHTPRHDSGASAFPCAQQHSGSFIRFLGG